MIKDSNTYQQGRISKLLLSTALLFSVFSFTGYGNNYQTRLEQAIKTELVVKKNSNFKRCVSFKNLTCFFYRNEVSKNYLTSIILALGRIHNNLALQEIKNATKQFIPQKHTNYQKLIPSDRKSNEYSIS